MDDHAAAFFFPLPHFFYKFLTAKLFFFDPLSQKLLFNDVLSSDTSVIKAWLPKCLVAIHPLVTSHDILKCEGQCVSDVKRSSHVWRWHHNAKFTSIFLDIFVCVYLEVSAFFPNFIKFIFYLFCIVKFCHFYLLSFV